MKYAELVGVYTQLEGTSKRLEKTHYLSEFLKTIDSADLSKVLLLIQGKVFPSWDKRKIGVAARLLLKAIQISTGIDPEKEWKQTGDLGKAAEQLVERKKQVTLFSQELTVDKVFENLQKLASLEGTGTVDKKVKLISELLTSATPLEARYIIRTVIEELRVGLGEGTIRDSIVWSYFAKEAKVNYDKQGNNLGIENREEYTKYIDAVQEAYDVVNDFSIVARFAKQKGLNGLSEIKLQSGTPIKVMLYPKAKNIEDAYSIVGKPAAFEYKYDGFRMQIHKNGKEIKIFTRRLDDVTTQFPDVFEFITEYVEADSFIIDCEAVGYDRFSKKYIAFQNISQRIKRKYDIEEIARKFPVEVNVFDVIYYNGENLIKKPFSERRKILVSMIKNPEYLKIKPAEQIITSDESEAEEFYQKSLDAGNEGIMVKNLSGIYKPGARIGYGVKVKPTMETLDVVLVGAEWGEGKRAAWLASFIIAVRDSETGEFLEIGRVGTGIKEKADEGTSFGQLTEMLKPLIIKEDGKIVHVKPEIVIEIDYEEIQKSPIYSSGYALRFPRFTHLREERSPEEITTKEEVEEIYESQRGRG
ncbi:ATP-dependent DNA ligase [Candidatus Woesearchaeota archaeon]|nr:ATP-dependent DNA ligase [Candidatus Woesearchaeota archaeon]